MILWNLVGAVILQYTNSTMQKIQFIIYDKVGLDNLKAFAYVLSLCIRLFQRKEISLLIFLVYCMGGIGYLVNKKRQNPQK